MLEYIVFLAPPIVLAILIGLARLGARQMREKLVADVAARGWQLAPGSGLSITVPLAGRQLRIENYVTTDHRGASTHTGLRLVGITGAPDSWLCPEKLFVLAAVPAGLVEVPTEDWFRGSYRVFSRDPNAFQSWCDGRTRHALYVLGEIDELKLESGTLSITLPGTRDLDVLDRAVAIADALSMPGGSARARLQFERRASGSGWYVAMSIAVLVGLLMGFIGAVIGTAIFPLPSTAPGRALAAPIVCPYGGVPDVIHYSQKKGNNWNVTCMDAAESRTWRDITASGDYPSCRFPTLTTAVLSFEVYGSVIAASIMLLGALRKLLAGSK